MAKDKPDKFYPQSLSAHVSKSLGEDKCEWDRECASGRERKKMRRLSDAFNKVFISVATNLPAECSERIVGKTLTKNVTDENNPS